MYASLQPDLQSIYKVNMSLIYIEFMLGVLPMSKLSSLCNLNFGCQITSRLYSAYSEDIMC